MFATAQRRLVQGAGWGLMVLMSAIAQNVAGAQSLEPSPSSASAKPWENPDTTSAKAMKRVADKAAKSAEPAKPAKATAKSTDAAKAADTKKTTPTPSATAGAPATPASPPAKDAAKPATAAAAAVAPAKPAAAATAAPAVVAPVVPPAPPVAAAPQTPAPAAQPSIAAAPSAASSPATSAATPSSATATPADARPAAAPAQWNPIETGSIATPIAAESDVTQYSDWILECFGSASKKCGLRQTVTDSRGRRIVQLTARHSGKTPYLEVIVPVGISIPFGVELQFADNSKVVPKLADCDAKGCRAVTALNENVLANIKSAKGLAVVFQDAKSGKVLKVSGSLAGFSDGVGKVIAGL